MCGYQMFKNIFYHLGDDCRRKILENIFLIDNISVFSFYEFNHRIFFRIYDGFSFYQFVFVLDDIFDIEPIVCFEDLRVFNYTIYTYCYLKIGKMNQNKYPYYKFVKLLTSSQEKEVYQLFRTFL